MDSLGIFNKLLLDISEEITKKAQDLESGKMQDFEQYRYAVGVIDGLKRSKQVIMKFNKKLLSGDDIYEEGVTQ